MVFSIVLQAGLTFHSYTHSKYPEGTTENSQPIHWLELITKTLSKSRDGRLINNFI
jgi:hypothetical protein